MGIEWIYGDRVWDESASEGLDVLPRLDLTRKGQYLPINVRLLQNIDRIIF